MFENLFMNNLKVINLMLIYMDETDENKMKNIHHQLKNLSVMIRIS